MVETSVNGRWTISMPHYRAERDEWRTGWERERLDSMYANLGPGDVVFDVGTEEGELSGLYAQWGCGLVLVEPNEKVWPNVKAVWEANGFPMPLGWWTGFATNTDSPAGSSALGDGSVWPEAVANPMIRAHGFASLADKSEGAQRPHIRLDTLSERLDVVPTAITIDVEGAEMLVLEGTAGLLDLARPLVWVSVHDEMIRYDYDYTSESVHQFMALHGYRMQLLAIDHECHWFYWPKERRDVESTLP